MSARASSPQPDLTFLPSKAGTDGPKNSRDGRERVRQRRRWLVAAGLLIATALGTRPWSSSAAGDAPATNPLLAATGVLGDEAAFEGRIVERLRAGHYAYLAIRPTHGSSNEPRWVATMGDGVAEGHRVHARTFSARDDFFSRRLDRHFGRVLFGIVQPLTSHHP